LVKHATLQYVTGIGVLKSIRELIADDRNDNESTE